MNEIVRYLSGDNNAALFQFIYNIYVRKQGVPKTLLLL